MQRRSSMVLAFGTLCLTACHGARVESPVGGSGALPLRSLRLYENGVGYFEREGTLSEDGAAVAVPAAHVDDALKTLLILSSGDARVSAVEFPSVVSDGAARSLAGLPLEGDTPVDYEHVLGSLRGFRVQLHGAAGAIVQGRLLDVQTLPGEGGEDVIKPGGESAPRDPGGKSPGRSLPRPDFSLLVVSETGALVRARTSEVTRIQPLDAEFSARLQTAADALGGRAAQLGRELRVLASGRARVRIGYIAETPVWRTSYRLVLPPTGRSAALQGFALVHNDTDEPWSRVAVELVNGSPDSFLFPLAAPRYARRPLVTPDRELSTLPQLATRTADGLWGDHVESEDAFGGAGLGLSGVGEGGGGYGEGIGLGSIGTVGRGAGSASEAVSRAITIGDLAATTGAAARDEGRLFSYALTEPVSLRAHGSALLPIIRSAVAARRLTRFSGDGAARAVVRFENVSPYILPAGPLAVFEAQGFAGETAIQRMVPGARAYLEYGVDLDVARAEVRREVSSDVRRVLWGSDTGRLEQHRVLVTERVVTLTNHGATPRTVACVLTGVVRNARVEGADELEFDEGVGHAVALLEVPAGKTLARTLRITEGRVDAVAVRDLEVDAVERLAATASLSAADRATLKAAVPRLAALRAADAKVAQLGERYGAVEADVRRDREHLKAAGGAAGASPIAARIVELEKALAALRDDSVREKQRLASLVEEASAVLSRLPSASLAPPGPAERRE